MDKGKWKNILLSVVRAVCGVAYCFIPYLKIFKDVAILPGKNPNGDHIIGRFEYPRSMVDRLQTIELEWLNAVNVVFACSSVVFIICSCIRWRNKKARIFTWILFGVSTAIFLLTLGIGARQYALY